VNKKDKILKDISLTCYIPLEVVKKIVSSQYEFIHDVIKGGDRDNPDTLKNINVQYFGKFAVKNSKREFYKKLKDDRTEGIDDDL
jgi:hypothetical protein